jgi:hypothetical protein
MDALQLRLNDPMTLIQESSAMLQAAGGLTDEQQLLVFDMELGEQIKKLTACQKDVRDQLKAWHKENVLDPETGEVKADAPEVRVGTAVYAPTVKASWTYNVPAFIKLLGDRAHRFLKVSGETVTAAIKSKELSEEFINQVRVNTPTVTHGIKVEK